MPDTIISGSSGEGAEKRSLTYHSDPHFPPFQVPVFNLLFVVFSFQSAVLFSFNGATELTISESEKCVWSVFVAVACLDQISVNAFYGSIEIFRPGTCEYLGKLIPMICTLLAALGKITEYLLDVIHKWVFLCMTIQQDIRSL